MRVTGDWSIWAFRWRLAGWGSVPPGAVLWQVLTSAYGYGFIHGMSTTATKSRKATTRKSTKSRRPALTPEQKAAKQAEQREKLAKAVSALQTSEGWQNWLKARSQFRRYTLVILGGRCPRAGGIGQLPTATCHRQLAVG